MSCREYMRSKKIIFKSLFSPEEELQNLPFPPKMLDQRLLVDFGTGQQAELNLTLKEVMCENPENSPDLLDSQELNLGFAKNATEGAPFLESQELLDILAVDIFLAPLLKYC